MLDWLRNILFPKPPKPTKPRKGIAKSLISLANKLNRK